MLLPHAGDLTLSLPLSQTLILSTRLRFTLCLSQFPYIHAKPHFERQFIFGLGEKNHDTSYGVSSNFRKKRNIPTTGSYGVWAEYSTFTTNIGRGED